MTSKNSGGIEGSGLSSLAAEAAALAEGTDSAARKQSDEPMARPVNATKNRQLYAARKKIHPKRVKGAFRNAKWIVMAITLAIYYLTPWIRWSRAGDIPDQAVLIDFQAQRFYFFFIEIWPQEFYYITGLLVLAALGLFLVTSVAGRIWCGYTCPQTVWTDLFIHIERWIEGDRNSRIRLDRAKWSLSKVSKRVIKHTLWILVSAATGGAWIFYFADAPTLAQEFFVLKAPATAYFSMGFFTISTYLLGGIAREQVCTYMCPWPRIQGAMFDEESFLISYRKYRGEPRGPHKKGTTWDGRGDCVDCNQCVNVCPMGIDIRDGIQLECIQCALCIDACNDIMGKIGRPRGLIAYETSGNLERRAQGEEPEVKLVRPRTVVYVAIMALIGTLMMVSLITRSDVDVNIIRDRNPVFVKLSDGSIRNGFTIRVLNKQHVARTFDIETTELDGAVLANGQVGGDRADTTVTVGPDTYHAVKFFVSLPLGSAGASQLDESAPIRFIIRDHVSGQEISEESVFRGPAR